MSRATLYLSSLPERVIFRVRTLVVFSALLVVAALPALAQTEKVLYSFGNQSGDGYYPYAGLVFDGKGNLYGTTYNGGEYICAHVGCGTVFEITSAGTEKVIHSFGGQSGDGYWPEGGLIFKEGNLYGATTEGAYLAGAVFEIATTGKKAGTEKVLYSLGSQSGDGHYPYGNLVADKEGNLYGTTNGGGNDYGTVFEITSAGTEKVLYSFGSQSGDGMGPVAGLVLDKEGNLYGTTTEGGAYGAGTVFEITSAGTEKVLYSFGSQPGDGYYADSGLIFRGGNLYGTTFEGGVYGDGTVFEFSTTGKKAGTEKVLYSFGQSGDGSYPQAGLVFDKTGNLYGTTFNGGAVGNGAVFEITSVGKKGSTEKVLYSFGSQPGDGSNPLATLIFDKEGNLYGTTLEGGVYNYGTVFEVIP
jgi:uncharacterized repeat protein (TIGR03803 family)